MRDFVFRFLTIILCIVLCFNFVRFLVTDVSSGEEFTTISARQALEVVSQLDADSRPLFNDLIKTASLLADIGSSFTDTFDINYSNDGIILGVLRSFFNFFYTVFIRSIPLIGSILKSGADFLLFVVAFLKSLYTIVNALFGTSFSMVVST